jgi:hypothetical protein
LIIHPCLNALLSPQFWQFHSALISRTNIQGLRKKRWVPASGKIPINNIGGGQRKAAEITGVFQLLNIVIAKPSGVEFGVEI